MLAVMSHGCSQGPTHLIRCPPQPQISHAHRSATWLEQLLPRATGDQAAIVGVSLARGVLTAAIIHTNWDPSGHTHAQYTHTRVCARLYIHTRTHTHLLTHKKPQKSSHPPRLGAAAPRTDHKPTHLFNLEGKLMLIQAEWRRLTVLGREGVGGGGVGDSHEFIYVCRPDHDVNISSLSVVVGDNLEGNRS